MDILDRHAYGYSLGTNLMREYYILTMHPQAREVLTWVFDNDLQFEVHLNRTRFWVPSDSSLHTYFQLWLSDVCPAVEN